MRSLYLRRIICIHAFVSVAVLAGCSDRSGDEGSFVRDSAGVIIVESHVGLWGIGDGWILSSEPEVEIGSTDGPEEYSLHNVDDVLRIPNGNIVVANRGTDQLKYYDSTGSYLYAVGQDGFGPGEFKRIVGMWLASDTLIINDYGQDRVSIYTSGGEYTRTVMLHREPRTGQPQAVGAFEDGSILGESWVISRREESQEGLWSKRQHIVLRRYSSDGVVLDSMGVFFFTDMISENLSSGRDPATGVAYSNAVATSAPFGRDASIFVSRDCFYYGLNDTYEIQVYSKSGKLTHIYRRPVPNSPVTERDKDRYREEFVGDSDDFNSWARRRVHDLEFPDTKPAYGRIMVDAAGNLWVSEYERRNNASVRTWTVFDTSGRMLGDVDMPTRFRTTDIGDDYVLGVWFDDFDVPYVRMYRLLKGGKRQNR